jgi:choline-sulfatase
MPKRRPNILVVMVDQLSGTFFPDGPADFLHTPHLKRWPVVRRDS